MSIFYPSKRETTMGFNLKILRRPCWLIIGLLFTSAVFWHWLIYCRWNIVDEELGSINFIQTRPINPNRSRSTDRKSILILTPGRSGSTFIGSLFNHHPDVLYVYEPLRSLERGTHCRPYYRRSGDPNCYDYSDRARAFLNSWLVCSFDSVVKDLSFYERDAFRTRSHALSRPPCCRSGRKTCVSLNQTGELTPSTTELLCAQMYSTTVVKELLGRIPGHSVDLLLRAIEQTRRDFRLVLLVRDPRAVYLSVKRLSTRWFGKADFDALADSLRNFSYAGCKLTSNALADLLKAKADGYPTAIMRYEDVVSSLKTSIESIYRFAGLEGLHFVQGNEEILRFRSPKVWTTSWRNGALWEDVTSIQAACAAVMQAFGYRPFDNEAELRDPNVLSYTESYPFYPDLDFRHPAM